MEKNKNILLFRQRKKLLVLLIILSLSYFLSNLSAQSYISKYEIKGTIVDEKLIPVEFSNIVLINPMDSSIIDGCVSDIDGKFSLKTAFEGKFLLKISFIGYDDCIKSVSINKSVFDCGDLILKSNTRLLGEVTITTKIPLMRIEKGKLIVNIENSILSDAGNINDMLSRTPGLITDAGGSISVPGKGSPIIYINNKEINSSAELNSLQPGDISKIEIIKNPSSKYSASGRAVIIIKTKKAKNNTTMLQVNDNMTIARKFSNITGLQLTQNIDKYSGMYSYSYGEYNQKQYLNQYQTISNSDYKMSSISDFTQTFKNRGHNIFAGIDYRIFKEHSFGLQFSGRFSDNFKYEDRMQTISKTNVNANELRKIRLDGETDTDFFNVDFNYRINPDSVNNFNFIAGYARQNYNNVNDIDESVVPDISINNSIINTNNKYNVYSFVADYQFNLKNLFITEIGGKASIIDNDGFSNHYYWPSIVQKSYNTNLTKEKIFAGYFN